MFRIALCDDDLQQCQQISALLQQYPGLVYDQESHLSTFTSGRRLLSAVEETGPFDIYLLDVIMPDMTGIELGTRLRRYNDDGIVIYLTSSAEFAVDAYEVRAFHYLLKPVARDRLFSVLDQAISQLRRKKTESFLIKSREGLLRVPADDILYAELANRSIRYHLKDESVEESVTLRRPFSVTIAPLLKCPYFILCGASFVVNLNHISGIKKECIVFKNGACLRLPKQAHSTLKEAWLNYWLEETV